MTPQECYRQWGISRNPFALTLELSKPNELEDNYIPFNELCPSVDPEGELGNWVRERRGIVGVCGLRGCGKTSLVNYIARDMEQASLFPILINAPRSWQGGIENSLDFFAREILCQLEHLDTKAGRLARSDATEISSTATPVLAGISVNLLLAKAELRKQLSESLTKIRAEKIFVKDRIRVIERLFDDIRSRGHFPAVLFDDLDKVRAGTNYSQDFSFLIDSLRELLRLDSLFIIVSPNGVSPDLFVQSIEIPPLPGPESVKLVIEKRMASMSTGDHVNPFDGLESIIYDEARDSEGRKGVLRPIIRLCSLSLNRASHQECMVDENLICQEAKRLWQNLE